MPKVQYSIVADDLKKSFGTLEVLKGINFKVQKGSITALLGPNGAGKTTIVRILATLLESNSGKATIEDYDVREQADEVRAVIGLTGQAPAIDEYLTGRENLRMIGRLYHLSKEDTNTRTEELLKEFDLEDAADRATKNYSGGMRRRLDLAASLIALPPVIFLDEPTTGLDPRSRLSMWEKINEIKRGGSTILLTTQYLEEADQLADHIIVIDEGKVIAEGTSDDLKNKVGKERVELVFADSSSLKQAEKILEGESVIDSDRNVISVPNEGGVKDLRKLLQILDDNGIPVESLSLRKPSLDEVFLKLTGHGTAEKEASEKEAL